MLASSTAYCSRFLLNSLAWTEWTASEPPAEDALTCEVVAAVRYSHMPPFGELGSGSA